MKIVSEEADNYRYQKTENNPGRCAHGVAAYHADDTSCDRGAGVDFPYEDIRGLTGQNIPDHAAAYPCENTYKNQEERVGVTDYISRRLNTNHSKDTQTKGIAEQHNRVVPHVFKA